MHDWLMPLVTTWRPLLPHASESMSNHCMLPPGSLRCNMVFQFMPLSRYFWPTPAGSYGIWGEVLEMSGLLSRVPMVRILLLRVGPILGSRLCAFAFWCFESLTVLADEQVRRGTSAHAYMLCISIAYNILYATILTHRTHTHLFLQLRLLHF